MASKGKKRGKKGSKKAPPRKRPSKKKGKKKARARKGKRRRRNPSVEDITERDISEALQRPPSFGYSGDLPLFETWSLGPVVDQRDATVLGKANWSALHRELEKHPEWNGKWQIVSSSHWAVGWVDHLAFQVIDDDGRPTEIFAFLKTWFDGLSEYPIADESLYSEMQEEAYAEQLERDLEELERRKLRDDLPDDWKEQMVEVLDRSERDYDEQDVPYHSESALEQAASNLGFLDPELAENPEDPPTFVILRSQALTIVSGELLGFDSRGNEVGIYDQVAGVQRSFAIASDDGTWIAHDEGGVAYEVLTYSTPRGGYEANPTAEVTIGPGFGSWLGAIVGGILGGSIGSLTALITGSVAAGILIGWTLAGLGAAVGGYMVADEDRKRRTAIGAGVGQLVFPILGLGAAVGGWFGASQPDPKEIQDLRKRRQKQVGKQLIERNSNPGKQSVRKIKNRVMR